MNTSKPVIALYGEGQRLTTLTIGARADGETCSSLQHLPALDALTGGI
jgi:hypothetical protein